jgi:hypothetical protein
MPDITLNRKQKPGISFSFCRTMSSRVGSLLVITQDVPADALALGRSRQITKKDWAKRLRGLKSLRVKKT